MRLLVSVAAPVVLRTPPPAVTAPLLSIWLLAMTGALPVLQ